MSFWQKLFLTKLHPQKIALDVFGLIWAGYFLWLNELQTALMFGIGFPVLGAILAWNKVDYKKMAKTWCGKIALAHLKPWNFAWHVLGILVLGFGIWIHSGIWILLGISCVAVGHLFDKLD